MPYDISRFQLTVETAGQSSQSGRQIHPVVAVSLTATETGRYAATSAALCLHHLLEEP